MSSEALERALGRLRVIVDEGSETLAMTMPSDEAAALLAEVARLEQAARNQAGEIRDLTECVRVFRAQVARLVQERAQIVGELQSAEEGEQRHWAALAVAREREQRAIEALARAAHVAEHLLRFCDDEAFEGAIGPEGQREADYRIARIQQDMRGYRKGRSAAASGGWRNEGGVLTSLPRGGVSPSGKERGE